MDSLKRGEEERISLRKEENVSGIQECSLKVVQVLVFITEQNETSIQKREGQGKLKIEEGKE